MKDPPITMARYLVEALSRDEFNDVHSVSSTRTTAGHVSGTYIFAYVENSVGTATAFLAELRC
jgi:hypothetical protein